MSTSKLNRSHLLLDAKCDPHKTNPLSRLRRIVVGLVVAGVFGTSAILFVFLNTMPSYVTKVRKFRAGVIESLHGPRFLYMNRVNPFYETLLVGSAFWGCTLSAVLIGGVFGGIAFLIAWTETHEYALQAIALILGE